MFVTDYIEIGKVCNASNVWIDDISDEKEVEIVLGSEKSLLTPSIILVWRRVFQSLLVLLFINILNRFCSYSITHRMCSVYTTIQNQRIHSKRCFTMLTRYLDNVMIASKLENVQWG